MTRTGGPATLEGRAISARNSLRHGLTARSILLPGESQAEWEQLRDAYVLTWLPVGPAETAIVFRMAELAWRLARVAVAEQQAAIDREEHPENYHVFRLHPGALTPYRPPTEPPEALPPGMPAPSAIRPIIRHEAHLWRQLRAARTELEALLARRRKVNPDLRIDLSDLPLSDAARAELRLDHCDRPAAP